MAASKRDQIPDDEPDWIASDKRASKKGVNGFALGGTVLVMLLVMGVFIMWQREETERRQAQTEWEQSVAMERALAQHDAEEHLDLDAQLGKLNEAFEQPTPTAEELRRAIELVDMSDQKRSMRLFRDGVRLLNDEDLDGAVEAFRQAAALDAMHAKDFEKALKLQTERDHTAPPPREVKQP